MKLVSVVTTVKKDKSSPPQRPMSDGVVYGNYNERRIEYEEILQSERTESQYSQTESYLSDRWGACDCHVLSRHYPLKLMCVILSIY